jgi:hypothetical protein
VLLELTVYAIPPEGWSVRFFPTLGRFIKVGMLMLERKSRSPMPEFSRIWGVLMAPAERMTSFVAVNCFLETDANQKAQTNGNERILTCKFYSAERQLRLDSRKHPGNFCLKQNVQVLPRAKLRREVSEGRAAPCPISDTALPPA